MHDQGNNIIWIILWKEKNHKNLGLFSLSEIKSLYIFMCNACTNIWKYFHVSKKHENQDILQFREEKINVYTNSVCDKKYIFLMEYIKRRPLSPAPSIFHIVLKHKSIGVRQDKK